MTESSIQFIGILVSVTALLGWLMKQVISYFIKSNNEKSGYIEKLVQTNQDNTTQFTNTVNHQQTLNRDMQQKTVDAIGKLQVEIANSNKVNERLLHFLLKREDHQ